MNVLLRLDDGREEHLGSSLTNIDPARTVVSMLRAGHRVTLIWATAGRGRRCIVASCYVHQIQRRFYYGARFVRGTLVAPSTQLAWLLVNFAVDMALRFAVDPHSWRSSVAWWALVLAEALLEAFAVSKAIDALLREADPEAAAST